MTALVLMVVLHLMTCTVIIEGEKRFIVTADGHVEVPNVNDEIAKQLRAVLGTNFTEDACTAVCPDILKTFVHIANPGYYQQECEDIICHRFQNFVNSAGK